MQIKDQGDGKRKEKKLRKWPVDWSFSEPFFFLQKYLQNKQLNYTEGL